VERAHFYKWLMWLTNTMQSTLIIYFYTDRWMTPATRGCGRAEVACRNQGRPDAGPAGCGTGAAGEKHAEPWLLGANYSAVDIYALTLCRWTRNFASQPARDRVHLGPYLQRALARPAVVKAFNEEGLAQPWV
jgi:glutathione S-transferase